MLPPWSVWREIAGSAIRGEKQRPSLVILHINHLPCDMAVSSVEVHCILMEWALGKER